jgi:hypothetical protein
MTSSSQRTDPQRRVANARLAWVLASAAAVFALGFVAKIVLFSH